VHALCRLPDRCSFHAGPIAAMREAYEAVISKHFWRCSCRTGLLAIARTRVARCQTFPNRISICRLMHAAQSCAVGCVGLLSFLPPARGLTVQQSACHIDKGDVGVVMPTGHMTGRYKTIETAACAIKKMIRKIVPTRNGAASTGRPYTLILVEAPCCSRFCDLY
jgi:hypothetical protein